MTFRSAVALVPATRTIEGGGFVVRRAFPTEQLPMLDPFLLLDEMGPVDWEPGTAVGAPPHPHRGFATLTYLLEGELVHRDSHGSEATLTAGDVQLMTAGSGVIHSEMPSRRLREAGGRVHGFQLWVNLPREKKMMTPSYQELPRSEVPLVIDAEGHVELRVLVGAALGRESPLRTMVPMTYLHISMQAMSEYQVNIPVEQDAFVYVFGGSAKVGLGGERVRDTDEGGAILLGREGEELGLASGHLGAEILVIGGEALREPVARYGPFVMNTSEELAQAMGDFQSGKFGRIPPQRA